MRYKRWNSEIRVVEDRPFQLCVDQHPFNAASLIDESILTQLSWNTFKLGVNFGKDQSVCTIEPAVTKTVQFTNVGMAQEILQSGAIPLVLLWHITMLIEKTYRVIFYLLTSAWAVSNQVKWRSIWQRNGNKLFAWRATAKINNCIFAVYPIWKFSSLRIWIVDVCVFVIPSDPA